MMIQLQCHWSIMAFHPSEINTLVRIPQDKPFPIGVIIRIKCLISLYNDWTYACGVTIDMRTVSYEDFFDYRCTCYNPEHPLGIFQEQRQRQLPILHFESRSERAPTEASTSRVCISHGTDLCGFPRFDMSTIGPYFDSVPTSRIATTLTVNAENNRVEAS